MRAASRKNWKVRSKVWLEVNGEPAFGQGRLHILWSIDQRGSILAASQATGISYRRIWGAIRDMERCIGHPLVLTQRGGRQGGGAKLTDTARGLMECFVNLQEGIQEAVDLRFRTTFKNFFGERSAQSADRSNHMETRSP